MPGTLRRASFLEICWQQATRAFFTASWMASTFAMYSCGHQRRRSGVSQSRPNPCADRVKWYSSGCSFMRHTEVIPRLRGARERNVRRDDRGEHAQLCGALVDLMCARTASA